LKFLERFWFGCGHCHGPDGCPLFDGTEDPPETGARHACAEPVGARAFVVFIVPLATAIAGAYFGGRWLGPGASGAAGWLQAAGGVAGFAIGVLLAKACVAWTPGRRDDPAGGKP
jgi:hypothetical protein